MDVRLKLLPKVPPPEIYELEYQFWPWGKLLEVAKEWVAANAPHSGSVFDYMCGTGYLLNSIGVLRSDLKLAGCSLDPYSYIEYAKEHYPHIPVTYMDAMIYGLPWEPDIVICTAGLHHLDRDLQRQFTVKLAREIKEGKYFILGEETIREYSTERMRRLGVLEMNLALIKHLIVSDTPDSVVEAALDLFSNDLFERGEYKLSLRMILKMFEPYFNLREIHQIWPLETSEYGDFLFIYQRNNRPGSFFQKTTQGLHN